MSKDRRLTIPERLSNTFEKTIRRMAQIKSRPNHVILDGKDDSQQDKINLQGLLVRTKLIKIGKDAFCLLCSVLKLKQESNWTRKVMSSWMQLYRKRRLKRIAKI